MHKLRPSWMLRLMSHFSYTQKFIIVSLLFSISLTVCGYFMIKAQNTAISFAELEIKGITYMRYIRKLFEDIPQHKWLAYQFLSGNSSVKNNLTELSSQIDTEWNHLIDVDNTYQFDLKTTPKNFESLGLPNIKPPALQSLWNDEQNLQTLTAQESNAKHDQLMEQLHLLLLYVGETANLILDPTIEANYFMEASTVNLPEAMILAPKIKYLIQNVINQKKFSSHDRDQILILTAFLEANLHAIQNDLHKGIIEEKTIQNNTTVENKLNDLTEQYSDSIESLLTYIRGNILETNKLPESSSEYLKLSQKVLENGFSLWQATIDQFDQVLKVRLRSYKRQQIYSIIISLLSALIGFVLGLFVMHEISHPLTRLFEATKRFAEGNLSTRIHVAYEDEVGQVGLSFNRMAESFQELIGQLQKVGSQLTASSKEINVASKQQESTILQQERTTKDIALATNEIALTAKELAKTMNVVNRSAEQTSNSASLGKSSLSQMETTMRQMVGASQNMAKKLAILSEKASAITSIITTITKIADQTNLLSLNAAIEAEKAGEHGRSFSVIAKEIRRLADQTSHSTLDVEKIVNEILSAVSMGVASVDNFSDEIHSGVNQVTNISEQLTKIIEQVQQQTKSIENANKVVQSQSKGAEQINEAVIDLGNAAQRITEYIHQFHTTIEELNQAALEMQQSVSKYKH